MQEIMKGRDCLLRANIASVEDVHNAAMIDTHLESPSGISKCVSNGYDELAEIVEVRIPGALLNELGIYSIGIRLAFFGRTVIVPTFAFAEVVEHADDCGKVSVVNVTIEGGEVVPSEGSTIELVGRPEFEALAAKVAEVEREQDNYVEKEIGKGLSSNNYTDADKAVVSNIKGIGAETNNVAEVAIGQYNVSSDNTLFSVGNGTSEDARRNAFEVRGARPLSATAYRLDVESDEDTLYAYNVKLAYVGQREDYYGDGSTNDAYIIYSSNGNIGVGTIVTIKVDEWDVSDPTRSASVRWVRDYKGENDYIQSNRPDLLAQVVVTRTLAEALVADNRVATTPSGDPMHYAYELEGAKWRPEVMLWSLNGINDLTTEEISAIYAERFVGNNHSIMSNWWVSTQQRTNMCRATNGSASSIANAFIHSNTIEAATLGTAVFYSWKSVFQNCSALRSIVGELNWKYMTASSHIDANVFKGCTSLENVRIKDLKQSVSFADSPRLSKASVLFMIQNASPTSAITITLDEGVRDNLYDDPEIEAALATHPLVTLGI